MSEKGRCSALYRAILAFDTETAEQQLQGVKTRSFVSVTAVTAMMVLWAVLLAVRYRLVKMRTKMFAIEVVCLVLTVASQVCTVLAIDECNPDRHLPFTLALSRKLRSGPFEWDDEFIFDVSLLWKVKYACDDVLALGARDGKQIQWRLKLLELANSTRTLHIIVLTICAVISAAFLVSLAIVVRSIMASRQVELETYTAVEPYTTTTVPTSVRSLQPLHDLEYLSGFLQILPHAPESVVLHAAPHCWICFEALLEDVAKLPACKHLFHRRCILHWLVYAEKLKCPHCQCPLRRVPSGSGYTRASSISRTNKISHTL